MPEIKTAYRSFLLRLWREDRSDAPWRVMLECVADPGERHYFKDLESLTVYLLALIEDDKPDAKGGK